MSNSAESASYVESTAHVPEPVSTDLETPGDVVVDREEPELGLDVVFDIVKNERRRLVLQYLAEHAGPVELGEIAEHIAAIENDKTVGEINSAERKRVYVGLYQCHLPKLESAGIVESERNSHIRLGTNADQVMEYVVGTADDNRPWHRYYLALSGIGVLAAAFEIAGGFGAASPVVLGTVIVALFATAMAHAVSTER